MNPTSIQGATRKLGEPAGWDSRYGECQTIEVRDARSPEGASIVQTAWAPDEQERVAIKQGRPITLTVWGNNMPPVALHVEHPPAEQPPSNIIQGQFAKTVHDQIAGNMMDSKTPVEDAWNLLRALVLNPDTTVGQMQDLKFCFFSGAQHLYATVLSALSPGQENTDQDLRRMQHLHDELDSWQRTVTKAPNTMGQAAKAVHEIHRCHKEHIVAGTDHTVEAVYRCILTQYHDGDCDFGSGAGAGVQ